ncbi:UDP-N-acetylglucosamine 2-epimerase (non-hydrolyzing) [candidate division KSB1 bacterium]|nr:UDP-N-acetylglucosamine 2-epimerase (non-hydrolyzing) [candidate division KSB1 bacterium]
MLQNKILFVFGTRPEAIKVIPVIKEFQQNSDYKIITCVTSQHKSMLEQVLGLFNIIPDYDLDIMKPNQTLSYITSSAIMELDTLLDNVSPDLIFVQGDTTTAMAAALSAFYHKIPAAHIEAGLRTYDKFNPYPEEINRVIISHVGDFHFAPTQRAKHNLIAEGIAENKVWVTGNTVIDALFLTRNFVNNEHEKYRTFFNGLQLSGDKKLILVTGHRRENFGEGFKNICRALKEIAQTEDVEIVYPVHLNPNVKDVVHSYLKDIKTIHLIDPLPYDKLIYIMNKSHLVLTDSGGIQEEAPSLGKPVLVMRKVTERPEGVESGTVKLVGTDSKNIVSGVHELMVNSEQYDRMSKSVNPYGDGLASTRICKIIDDAFKSGGI